MSSPYQSLGESLSYIRVLDLHPGRYGDQLTGELRIVSLSSGPHYEALSYTWGSNRKEKSMFIDGCGLQITNNLFNALQRLRNEDSIRCLWVDAICINQSDDSEKGHQISIMGQIYTDAVRVLVWIGEVPSASQRDVKKSRQPIKLKSNRSRRSPLEKALEAALKAADTKWHDRMWIVQEIALAKSAVLCFGPYSMPYDPFELGWRMNIQADSYLFNFYNGTSALYSLKMEVENGKTRNIADAAGVVNYTSCQNPEDRLYGLLSLIDPKEASLIPVDLRQSTAEVFARATYASIIGLKSFAILDFIDLKRGSKYDLPSWAADFTSIGNLKDTPSYDQIHGNGYGVQWPRNLDHGGSTATLSKDARALTVTGFVLSSIVDVFYLPSEGWATFEGMDHGKGEVRDFAERLCGFLYKVLKGRFRHCSTAEVQRQPETVMTSDAVLFLGTTPAATAIFQTAPVIMEDIMAIDKIKQPKKPFWENSRRHQLQKIKAANTALWRVHSHPNSSRNGSMVFATTNHNIGVGAPTLQQGDRVVLIRNGTHPLVVRPVTQGHCFHGFAWVQSVPDGVDIRSVVGNNAQEEQFILV